jgi:MinD superfamily P-loop ATPase
VLVTEPTPFGLNDLKLAVEMVNALGIRSGVVINQADIGDAGTKKYCSEKNIPLLAEIPHDRKIAEAYAEGTPAVRISASYENLFREIWSRIEGAASK